MPSVFIPTPQFPNIPILPGVPQLARPIGALGAVLPAIIAKFQTQAAPQVLFQATKAAPVWGIFDLTGSRVIAPDSIMAFGLRSEYRVSDYPVQDGQFASYDKVTVPREIMLRMVKGSTLQDRVNFEDACEFVAASLDAYTIITPERTYTGMNPLRHEVNRVERKGAFFIECEMFFRLIQVTDAQYSTPAAAAANTANASQPASIPPASVGVVQPTVPSTQVQNVVNSVLFPLGKLPIPGGL
jgi:hypothetical protein